MAEKDNVMTANRTVREWKAKHKCEYDSFKRQVAAIGGGDLSLMERMMGLLDDCMPQDARSFYTYIYNYIVDPDSVRNDQRAFSRYDQLAADCISLRRTRAKPNIGSAKRWSMRARVPWAFL